MFSKEFLVFGFLAICTYQVSNAQLVRTLEISNLPVSTSTTGNLVDQIREIIRTLEELLNGVIYEALTTLRNLTSNIQGIEEKYLNEGITLIKNIFGELDEYITNTTNNAVKLGVNITVCVNGTSKQRDDLYNVLIANFSNCIDQAGENVLNTINKEIVIINLIIRNITKLPIDLTRCVISERPTTCLIDLLTNASAMILKLPRQIAGFVDNALSLVRNLPIDLGVCLADIGDSTRNQTQQITKEIGDCVDNISNQNGTTANAPSSTSAPVPVHPHVV